ncbi:methyltransferase [Allorhodopirellula solitaria]|uniref:Carminomycin 4-O-methyltransferase n=1 Tax=Allorhodopirellula solitaria TaxID=2527987 RepID=A0A5C5YDW2_9BACT|nr:methyltransferase [Allorhodopirellula solitaria]TWT73926.1 Carminomycin 4-O-methyltransferase [Allorhodopirellula solitaria]
MTIAKLTESPTTDPATILRFRDRQYAADLIAAAILEFDLFSFLQQREGISFAEICEHYAWKTRPADVLMTLCRASGFVVTDEAGGNRLTDVGREFLTTDSPWFLGPYYRPIADSPVLKDFVTILKTGKPANWQAKSGGADWHESMKDESFANSFTELMNCRGIAFGQKLAEAVTPYLQDHKYLLDIGGGSGIYSTTMVARHEQLHATVFEQAPVDAIARREIERLGLGDRVNVVAGDMFQDPWPENADVILLSNLLHDWDNAEAQSIVDRAADSLSPGGLIIIHGAIINADKTGPLPVAEYSSLLMNITQGKCYSVTEYQDFLAPHGFDFHPYEPTIGDRGFLVATKQP